MTLSPFEDKIDNEPTPIQKSDVANNQKQCSKNVRKSIFDLFDPPSRAPVTAENVSTSIFDSFQEISKQWN